MSGDGPPLPLSSSPAGPAPGPEDGPALEAQLGSRFAFHEGGFRHPTTGGAGSEGFTAYADITHLWRSRRGLRLATVRGITSFSPRLFAGAGGPTLLHQVLRQRLAELPDGPARLQAMDALDRRVLEGRRPRLGPGLALACAAVFALQVRFPAVEAEGAFSATLVGLGELWRLVTANLLHGHLPHLLLNGIGLWVLGGLLERCIGVARTGLVMAGSGLGAMAASALWQYAWALGASGILAGIVGGLLVLELARPAMVPGPWRLPRRLLIGAVLADAVLLAAIPGVAHAAHAGGLVSGALLTGLVTRKRGKALLPIRWVRLANAAAVGLLAASLVVVGWSALRPEDARLRRAHRLLQASGASPTLMNNEAWTIAVSEDPAPRMLDVAERLAERAVEATGRRDPNLLDTLAEIYFQRGDRARAVETIDEAISLSPERYFREQRRRFTGERPAEDRPAPPGDSPPMPAPLEEPEPRGIRV